MYMPKFEVARRRVPASYQRYSYMGLEGMNHLNADVYALLDEMAIEEEDRSEQRTMKG